MMLSVSVAPLAMPAPQSVAPVPGDFTGVDATDHLPAVTREELLRGGQVVGVRVGTGSSACCRPLTDLGVLGGSGLSIGTPYPLSTFLMIAVWSTASCSAWRM